MSVLDSDVDKAKVAATLLLTSPGTPFIYYGEEIGMVGVKPDEDIRVPMQWSGSDNAGFTTGIPWRAPNADYATVNVATQSENPDSLLRHYQSLTQLRKNHPALKIGGAYLVETGNPAVFAFLRHNNSENILIVVNLGETAIKDYRLSLDEDILPDGSVTPTSLLDELKAKPLEITNGKFDGYQPLDELIPVHSYIFEIK
jgi:glycosidase